MKIYLKILALIFVLILFIGFMLKCKVAAAQISKIVVNRKSSEQLDLTRNQDFIATKVLKDVYCQKYYDNHKICSVPSDFFKAHFRDFDNDGINEIIGIYDNGHNRTIYILRKESDNYVDLYTINDSIKKTIANINYLEKEAYITFNIKTFERNYNGDVKILNFLEQSSDNVKKIAKASLIKAESEPYSKKMYKDVPITAFYEDLDSDGIDEIIGEVQSTYFGGNTGHSLFILKKYGNSYKPIIKSQIFFPFRGVKLTKNGKKTYFEFYAIKFVDTNIDYENKFIFLYDNGSYSQVGAEQDLVIRYVQK